MGLRKLPYWLANIVFDYFIFIFPLSIFIVGIYAFGESAEFFGKIMKYLIPMLLLFAFSFISYSYIFSYMFQKSSTAFRLFPFFNLVFFYYVPQIFIFIDTKSRTIQYLTSAMSPFMTLNNAFQTVEVAGSEQSATGSSIIVLYFILVIQTIFYLTGTILI